MPGIPHLALPLRIQGSAFAVIGQDSIDDITQCVRVVLTTPEGSREEVPEFGLPDQVFRQGGADLEAIEDAITEWEPRADAEVRGDDSRLVDGVSQVIIDITGGA